MLIRTIVVALLLSGTAIADQDPRCLAERAKSIALGATPGRVVSESALGFTNFDTQACGRHAFLMFRCEEDLPIKALDIDFQDPDEAQSCFEKRRDAELQRSGAPTEPSGPVEGKVPVALAPIKEIFGTEPLQHYQWVSPSQYLTITLVKERDVWKVQESLTWRSAEK